MADLPILSLIGIIAFYGLAAIFLTSMVFSGVTFAVYQRKLNKQKIGLAALIISLIDLAIAIVATVLIIVFIV